MTGLHRAAVIPTRNRHEMLADCINSVVDQVDRVIVIDNGSDPQVDPDPWQGKVGVLYFALDPPNISRFWNLGLSVAAQVSPVDEWDVAVLNDDVVVPPGWVETLSARMRATTAVLAYPDQAGGQREVLHTEPGPVPLSQRITGYAFMLRGELDLRAAESMAWWFSDDSLEWEARQRGGSLLVPGVPVQHRAPDVQTNARPELVEQTRRDRETFINRWGKAPW